MGGYRRKRKPGAGAKPIPVDEKRLTATLRGFLINGIPKKDFPKYLGISMTTWHNWKSTYPFINRILAENQATLNAKVAASLLDRALGFENPNAVKLFYDRVTGNVIQEQYTEYYPPDVNAIKYYLNNKMPEKWKERSTSEVANSGTVEHTISWEETPGCEPLKPMEDLTDNMADEQTDK